MEVHQTVTRIPNNELHEVGDEVTGQFRCAVCDLLVVSPKENDGVLVLPACPLCSSEEWRRVE
jgi:Zn finger protein HypA/HybF involved in hydrogenase expression